MEQELRETRNTSLYRGRELEIILSLFRGGKLGIFPSTRAYTGWWVGARNFSESQSLYRGGELGIFLGPTASLEGKKYGGNMTKHEGKM